jgi:hypothetical protein
MGMQRFCWVLGAAIAASTAAGCQIEKSANPLSPIIAGPIEGVVITTPNLLEPGQDWQIHMRDQPVRLMIQNAGTSGVRPITYTFEIATDAAFTSIVFKRVGVPPGDGVTTLQLPDTLPTGRTYWWRVRAEDGANASDYSKAVSFVAVQPTVLGAPIASSPTGAIATITPEFKVKAGSKSGPVENTVYTLHVAFDQAFSQIVAVFVVPETGPETTIAQNYAFEANRTFYWRVQAKDTGASEAVSPWSSVQSFTTGPASGGGGGASCGQTDPLSILTCNRSKYPEHMSSSQIVAFLRGSARDMTKAGVSGGPFGILQKTSGNNCQGYSCDIICAGQGSSQKQWDVLIDEKYVNWGSPIDNPTVRVCEIQ